MTLSPIDRSERHLLAAVHRWARTNGWRVTWSHGWTNGFPHEATVRVSWDEEDIGISRLIDRLSNGQPVWSHTSWIRVTSVTQAVDVLVAFGVLPPFLSSAYGMAVDNYRERVESLEEDLARKDHYLSLADDTIAGLIEENRELRQAASAAQLSTVGGEVA